MSIGDCRFQPRKTFGAGFLLSWEILTETKIPDVDLAIASGIWLFLQADQCGVARNKRKMPSRKRGTAFFSRCAAKTELCVTVESFSGLWFLSIPKSSRHIQWMIN